MIVYTAVVWHRGRSVWSRLYYEVSNERGYTVSRLRTVEEISN